MKSKRIIDLGAMTTKIAIKEIENLTMKLFLSKERKKEKDLATQEQIAEIVFSKLSQLRGTGLKLLQALSLDEEVIPEPYIKKFEAAYGKVSPLSRPVVKKVFKNEIGHPPEEIFAQFNYSASAAASLGQVHNATLKSGEKVVVKIQYPNVAENMQTDLKFIKSIAGAIGNPLIQSSIEELSHSLMAETDYELEAENIKLFNSLVSSPRVFIPTIYDDLSSSKVLTLSRVPGDPLNSIDSKELKNQALQQVFDFFFYSLINGHCIHADPHPGNILVSDLGTGIVDFGSVKKDIPTEVKELFLNLMKSQVDQEAIVKIYRNLGADVSKGSDKFYNDHVKNYHELCASIVGKDLVDFEALKKTVSKMRRTLFLQTREAELYKLSPEFTLLHKSFHSLLFMLCKYKAKICTVIPE